MLTLLSYLVVAVGCIIQAAGINLFIVSQHLASGGLGGLALLAQYAWGLRAGVLYILANIPLAFWLVRTSGWQGLWKTVVGFVVFSVALDSTSFLSHYSPTTNPLLAALYAGIVGGIGSWFVFMAGGSSGGTGVLATILHERMGVEIGRFLFLFDFFVMGLAGVVFHSLETTLYSWIASFVGSAVLERLTAGLRASKLIKVYSDQAEEIAAVLLEQLNRGVTYYDATGAYTGQKRKVVECILEPNEVRSARQIALEIDPTALLIVLEVADTYGRGFTVDGNQRRVPIWRKASHM